MKFSHRIESLIQWGSALSALLDELEAGNDGNGNPLADVVHKAYQQNRWFVPGNTSRALRAYADWLDNKTLRGWTLKYPDLERERKKLKVGLVLAGNLPAVGFHDILCVLVSGHHAVIRMSSDDTVLIPFLLEVLVKLEPGFSGMFSFVSRLEQVDAVIATGSNNTSRYFDYYFSRYPHIIRRNRNGVAVLSGKESEQELKSLGDDIFSYFGLGCRNVSKLYVPPGYGFDAFFAAMESCSSVMQHNKFMNNYDYHRALYLLNSENFLTNNFLILRHHADIATPVAVVHYENYPDESWLRHNLKERANEIQCIIGKNYLPFGTSQKPALDDYADGVDTLKFLLSL